MSGQPDMPLPVTSSLEPEFTKSQAALYREVLLLFNQHQIPYAVSGAFALQQHTGIWRTTKDLDLFLTSETVSVALRLLRKQGYHCEILDPVWLAKAHRDDFFVDMITGMSNAAITVTDSWVARARPAVVVGVETRVLAPEELVASKVFVTRRERFDGADIVHVVYGTQGELDWERIFALVGEHWEMLLYALVLFRYVYPAQTHYVPDRVWHELIARLRKEIKQPKPSARFRGSLIDDKMFAIDVNEWGLPDLLAGVSRAAYAQSGLDARLRRSRL
ncbi:MAG: nucleotidyl transferase [Acidobacteria bacterium]|nr:MAG: nucleotidyl transferase [Acidobacteriota bacterium]